MSSTFEQPAPPRLISRARRAVTEHPVVSAGATLVIGALVIWLVFFYFAFHLLFTDDKVDEADPFASGSSAATSPGTTTPAVGATTPAVGAPKVTHRGSFVDRSHPASGVATITTDGAETFLRFEDFRTDNGPDLFVYLSAGVTATSPVGALDDDFVDLGKLKGNIGSQNYEISPGTDLTRYRTVVIWCRRFTTAFGTSDLTPTEPSG
ncbi:MAG: DM13 domain-containing protein [Acidimicrobiales bacterium]